MDLISKILPIVTPLLIVVFVLGTVLNIKPFKLKNSLWFIIVLVLLNMLF